VCLLQFLAKKVKQAKAGSRKKSQLLATNWVKAKKPVSNCTRYETANNTNNNNNNKKNKDPSTGNPMHLQREPEVATLQVIVFPSAAVFCCCCWPGQELVFFLFLLILYTFFFSKGQKEVVFLAQVKLQDESKT